MTPWNAPYLAGVLDSDGSFTITKRHCYRVNCNYTCMVQLTWTLNAKTNAFIESLIAVYGGSYFIGLPTGSTQYKNSKEIIKYCGTGAAAEGIARDTKAYLVLKQEQAENIIRVREAVRIHSSYRPQATTDLLEALYIANKQLNGKNSTPDLKATA